MILPVLERALMKGDIMKWIDYREALGVSFSDSDKVEMLNNKIIVLFDSLPDIPYQSEEKVCKRYFSDVGERTPNGYYTWHEVKKSIIKKPTASDLISYTIAFSNASKKEQMIRIGESVFCDLIRYLDELKIDYEVIKDDNGYFLFPKGAKELDEANVNIPFEWLRKYPQARQSMEVALRHYSNKERPSQVADDFRKALETFAKEFFQNDRSLENQKTEFGKYLKEKL